LGFYYDDEAALTREPSSIGKRITTRFARGKLGPQKQPTKDVGRRIRLDLSWVFRAMSENVEQSSSQQIMSAITALNELLKNRQFVEIGLIFAIISPKRLSPELMLTLIRVSFPVRGLVTGWYQFVRKIKNELDERRLDSRKLLIGLL
jgi:hypothetical protein